MIHCSTAARLERAGAHPALLRGAHQAGALEQADVLQEARHRHGEAGSERTHAGRPIAQPLDHRAARGIGKGGECGIDLIRHLPN